MTDDPSKPDPSVPPPASHGVMHPELARNESLLVETAKAVEAAAVDPMMGEARKQDIQRTFEEQVIRTMLLRAVLAPPVGQITGAEKLLAARDEAAQTPLPEVVKRHLIAKGVERSHDTMEPEARKYGVTKKFFQNHVWPLFHISRGRKLGWRKRRK